MNRRNFLQTSMMGLGSLGIPCLANSSLPKNDKSVIFVFLSGGMTQCESWNGHPNAITECRSVTGNIKTKIPDLYYGGNWNKLASITDKIATVKSYQHRDANHSTATHYQTTGYDMFGSAENAPQKEPSVGSIVSKYYLPNNPENGLPHYVKVNQIQYDDSAYLGGSYVGFDVNSEGLSNLSLRTDKSRFLRRNEMANSLDRKSHLSEQVLPKSWTDLRNQSADVLCGSGGDAFKIELESEQTLQNYNVIKSQFGKNCLMARRLVEAGSKVVNVSIGGWDFHSGLLEGSNRLEPETDNALYTLITDLSIRGLLEKTLVVVTTEFGRTYKLNQANSRDHWPQSIPLLLIGGKYSGSIIGRCDVNASAPTTQPFTPKDLTYTIFDHLGLDKNWVFYGNDGRPHHLIQSEARLIM